MASDRNEKLTRRSLITSSLFLGAAGAAHAAHAVAPWLGRERRLPSHGQQEGQDIYVELRNRAARPITMAVPALSMIAGAEAEATALHDLLWDDLHHSMVFDMVDPEFYPPIPNGDAPPDWPEWQETGAEAMIRGFVRRAADGTLVVDFRLYDVQSQERDKQITGQRYHERPNQSALAPLQRSKLRYIAHDFADQAVLYYTGIPGVASTKIAFVSNRAGPKEIFVMECDGFGQQRITYDGGLALAPAFSPKGDQIAYVSYRMHDDVPNVDIAMLNRGGGVPPAIMRSAGQDTSPAWSPDGGRIAFASTMDGQRRGNQEIYSMEPDGSDVVRLSTNSEIDTSPTYSPNGREIAFISTRAGGQHLYIMGIDGTNVRRVRVEGSQIDSPAWNPNPQISDLICYAASEGGNRFQIFVYSLSTGQSTKLTRGFGRADSPSWSPDGRQIVFEASQGNRDQLYAIGLDGSRLRQLTRDGNNQSPSWGGR